MLPQGQINPGAYIQSIYPGGQQQVLLSSAGGLTLQQAALSQGITVVQNPPQKLAQAGDNKQVLNQNQSKNGVVTSQAGPNKVQNMPQRAQSNQQIVTGQGQSIITGHPQAQFVAQTNGNGQLFYSPLGVIPQGSMVSSSIQTPPNQKNAQQKFIGQQKGGQGQLQITSMQNSPYRHINPGQSQPLITTGGQPVLGQPQIISPLQTFNAFGSGLSWAGQLQGNSLLQSPILIRQSDGNVYLQSASAAQQQQQQIQPMQVQQQLQTSQVSLPGLTSFREGSSDGDLEIR